MNTNIYEHKPAKLGTKQDLIDFIASIPDDYWIVDDRGGRTGDRTPVPGCILGHAERAYPDLDDWNMFGYLGIGDEEIAAVNNGAVDLNYLYDRADDTKTDGASIKARLIHYLQTGTYNPKP